MTNKEKLDEIYKQNLENDIIGKYVERLMRPEEPETQQNTGAGMKHKTESSGGGVTKEFLARYGF